jgi:hypothetical protein
LSEAAEAVSMFWLEFIGHLVIGPLVVHVMAQGESSFSPCLIFSWRPCSINPVSGGDVRDMLARSRAGLESVLVDTVKYGRIS